MRVMIKAGSYHGKSGFHVRGSGDGPFRPAVFVETMAAAERCKARMKAGESVRGFDMVDEPTADHRRHCLGEIRRAEAALAKAMLDLADLNARMPGFARNAGLKALPPAYLRRMATA